jgi:parallel beta-helix repeat protein
VTLTRYGNEEATLQGRLWVSGAHHLIVSELRLNGRNANTLPSPTIHADDVAFVKNNVTNDHTSICFSVGSLGWANITANRVTLEANRIHNCGVLPSGNRNHGIYMENTSEARIVGNAIYDNVDRGIQLYPSAQRSLIAGNIIDGNGEGIMFSGDGGVASSDNLVRNNVITNAALRANVESWYPAGNPKGTGNAVTQNCVHGGVRLIDNYGGFEDYANVFEDPQYIDRANKNFGLRSGSPCQPVLDGARADFKFTAPPTGG